MKKNNVPIATMVCAVLAAILIGGCGKKDAPFCPAETPPFAVSSVSARAEGVHICVNWKIDGDATALDRIRLFRSELPADGTACPSCRREFSSIADVPPDDASLAKSGDGMYSYTDASARGGFIYSYRVAACTADGRCAAGMESADMLVVPSAGSPETAPQGTAQ